MELTIAIPLAIIAGVVIGLVLGFVGAGGAMLAVPILIYLFEFTPLQATTAALVVVGSAALSGALPKFKRGEVLIREAVTISGLSIATNVTFALLAPRIPQEVITTGLALVLLVAGWSMLQRPFREGTERRMPVPVLILLSLGIGVITGLFGIGGGFVAIPILVLFFNTPVAKAAGTSLLIIALNSAIAFIVRNQSWSEVEWSLPITMAAMAIIISRIASTHSSRVPHDVLKRSFAGLLFAIAIFTLIETWFITL
ncbi:MAG: sulfite exporter TauE/SafE family protein [Candidatus Nanopelagicaceae bacterium]